MRGCSSELLWCTACLSQSCRYPYKEHTHQERQKKRSDAVDGFSNAKTPTELGKMLSMANHYNGVIVHCVKTWLGRRPNLEGKVILFGAPFEAEAQCVYLERCNIVDGILSSDSDIVFHGAERMYSGYNTLGRGPKNELKAYIREQHPCLKNWTPVQRAAFATFVGCDYIKQLHRAGWAKGVQFVNEWTSASEKWPKAKNPKTKYLQKIGPEHGRDAYNTEFEQCIQHFLSYPIWRLTFDASDKVSVRQAFWNNQYSIELSLARDSDSGSSIEEIFPRLSAQSLSDLRDPVKQLQFARMETWARGDKLEDIPLPTNSDGVEIPYAAVIRWQEGWRVEQLRSQDLRHYLLCHGIAVSQNHPVSAAELNALTPIAQETFAKCVHELVEDLVARRHHDPVPATTLCYDISQPWVWNTEVPILHLSHDTFAVLEVVERLTLPTDDALFDVYGVRNEVSKRALRLLKAANSFVDRLEVLEAKPTTADSSDLLLLQMPVLASMKNMTYHVLLAFEKEGGKWKNSPYSICSCPSGCNCCSHQIQMLGVLRMLQLFYEQTKKAVAEDAFSDDWTAEIKSSPGFAHMVSQQDSEDVGEDVSSPRPVSQPVPQPAPQVGEADGGPQNSTPVPDAVVGPRQSPSQVHPYRANRNRALARQKLTAKRKAGDAKRRSAAASKGNPQASSGGKSKRSRSSVAVKNMLNRFHGEITNDRTKSRLREQPRTEILRTVLKYFPPNLRGVTALSIPISILKEASDMQDKFDKEKLRRKRKRGRKRKSSDSGENSQQDGTVRPMAAAQLFHEVRWSHLATALEEDSGRDAATHPLDPALIMKEQRRLAASIPRFSTTKQHVADLEFERAFALMASGDIPHDSLIGHYLIHERENRLRRMKAYREAHPEDPDDPEEHNVDDNLPVAPRTSQNIATTLRGTWECQELASEDVAAETIYVDAIDGRRMFGKYKRDGLVFAIKLTKSCTKLVPGGNISRRERRAGTFKLREATSTVLVWENVESRITVEWTRVSDTPLGRVCRSDAGKHQESVESILAQPRRAPRSRRNRHACACGRDCTSPKKFRGRCPSFIPRHKELKRGCTPKRAAQVHFFNRYVNAFRWSLGLDTYPPKGKRQFVRRHHWPKAFWARFGDRGTGTRLPTHLSVDEAIELGMYDAGRIQCKDLLVDHPTDVNSDGKPKKVVLCVPWKSNSDGALQYPDSGDGSEPNEDPGQVESDVVDDPVPTPPHPLSERFLKMNAETCRQHFGYRSHREMLAWMKVHFPGVQETYSVAVGNEPRQLTHFEQALLTRMFFRAESHIGRLASDWGIKRRRAGEIIEEWSKKWEFHAKLWSRLTFSREYLLKCQIQGMNERYGVPISHLVDGTVCPTHHPRKSNASKKCMWNNKVKHAGTLALAHATPTGLILFATDMYGGNATEVDLVRIYKSWWSAYPGGFGRLVDKGFARMTNLHYRNGSKAVYPAFVTKKSAEHSLCRTQQLTRKEIVDSAQQSRERYVIETAFSRIKQEAMLNGIVRHADLQHIDAAYAIGCLTANQMQPLRKPESWSTIEEDFAKAQRLDAN